MTTAPLTAEPATRSQAAAILLGAAGTGLAGDLLFHGSEAPGLNMPLFVGLLVIAATLVSRRFGRIEALPNRWLLTALGFAACLAVRDAEFLIAFNILAMLLALSLGGLALRTPPHRAPVLDYLITSAVAGFSAAFGAALVLGTDGASRSLTKHSPRRLVPVAAGLALAAIIVAVFGSLFASADPLFNDMATALFRWDLGPAIEHLVLFGVLTWVCAGLMRAWLKPQPAFLSHLPLPKTAEALPATIAVGAMVLVFLLFVATQVRSMFGGSAFIESIPGLTYAEYARKGFFEMVAATGLAVPVLYGADAWLAGIDERARRQLRHLGSLQLALMSVVLISALHRFNLYIGMYGLTVDRIIGVAVLAWLGSVIVWFAVTTLRGRRERFTFGAVVSGFTVLALLNAVNPEALIVRYNTARERERPVDTATLERLSADAAPALSSWLEARGAEERCALAGKLLAKWQETEHDWRTWNRSRSRAARQARAMSAWQAAASCPAVPTTSSAAPTSS